MTPRSILLTRTPARGEALADKLRAAGARVECRPSIELVPPEDPESRRNAVVRLSAYDWVVFTGRNGVQHFLSVLEECGRTTGGVRIAAVGQATAADLCEAGVAVDLVAPRSDSFGLGEALAGRIVGGERILHVRPERGDERLPELLRAAGGKVDSVAFYRNVPAPGVRSLARDLCDGRFDIAILTSPSSLERLLETRLPSDDTLETALRGISLVALGRTTAAAIRQRGFPVAAVATEPTDDAIVRALATIS